VGIQIDDISIAARDGRQLAATVFIPAGKPRGGVLINSATAVPRNFYRVLPPTWRNADSPSSRSIIAVLATRV
jgi:predicted alpha/beta hydrolase